VTSPFRYLLDTNAISDLARNPRGRGAERLAAVGSDVVATSIRFGLAKLEAGATPSRLADNVRRILAQLPAIPFESPADEHYGDIRHLLERAGTPIGPNDLLIAAHARALGLTLATDNVREFARVPELEVVNWAAG
jgi:tRNA(fMet)-specific endonuclease VapC